MSYSGLSVTPRFWFVVPAAGVGARMAADRPKQYLQLGSLTVLDHTLSRLLSFPRTSGIQLAVSDDDPYWPHSRFFSHPGIQVCSGGKERADSVNNALKALRDRADASDWVLVHDVARPCITHDDLNILCDTLKDHPVGGLLGIPLADTLKWVGANGVERTVDRRYIWRAFTPQMFRYEKLLDALAQAKERQQDVTDEASAIELLGFSPQMIEGRADNIKITRPGDLELAEFYCQQQEIQGITKDIHYKTNG
ncbi:MAG: 2-C-methyl-D-erythritol 4-phosphate cytidylyltransferase [Hahellaceae bacterium]|nr:2-C-methyl-D-erythritol 4-phosphate cytidylyltransferase [Hahellaceae bacterium]